MTSDAWRHRRSFTLTEILAVLVIIAVLAAIITPVVMRAIKEAKITKCANNLRQISATMEMFQLDHNSAPTTTTQLYRYLDNPNVLRCPFHEDAEEGRPSYLSLWPATHARNPAQHVVYLCRRHGSLKCALRLMGDGAVRRGIGDLRLRGIGVLSLHAIVFTKRVGSWFDMFLMETDGSNPVNVTDTAGAGEAQPRWSPDRTEVLFSRHEGSGTKPDIWVMNMYNHEVRNITQTPAVAETCPDWSPTGDRIVFDRDNEIWIMNLDGSDQHQITAGHDIQPCMSPDGKQIVFSRAMNPGGAFSNWQVFVVNDDGTGQQRLTTTSADDHGPSWSRNGGTIAFARNPGTYCDQIFLMDPDGTNQRNISNNSYREANPSWLPDGLRMVFHRAPGAGSSDYDICIMNADGSDPRNLTNTPGVVEASPD